MNSSPITFSSPSTTVQVHLPDGLVLEGPRGACASDFLRPIFDTLPAPAVGVVINGQLHELNYPIQMEAQISPITMADADGARIYRRSLVFLFETVFSNMFPNAKLTVDHSVSSGGFYCQVSGRAPLTVVRCLRTSVARRAMSCAACNLVNSC